MIPISLALLALTAFSVSGQGGLITDPAAMASDFDSGSSDAAGQNAGRKQTGQAIDGIEGGVDSFGGSVQDSVRRLPLKQLDDLYAPVLTQTARQTDPVFNAVKCPEGYRCYKIPPLPRNEEARVFRLQELGDQLRGRWKG